MEAQSASKYYVHRKPLLMLGFDWAARIAKHGVIARRYKEAPAAALVAQARQEFELLIPQLPFIGGRRNPLTPILIASAMFLALYKPLKARGAPAEEIGDVVYGVVEGFYRSLPRSLLRFYGGLQFRAGSRRKAREWAAESQRRQYAGDWVYQVVEEGEYDWGVDYVECGIWKFFGQQGAEEFVPYLCRLDFLASEWFDWELVRTTTIAGGSDRCDFRFKRRRGRNSQASKNDVASFLAVSGLKNTDLHSFSGQKLTSTGNTMPLELSASRRLVLSPELADNVN